jgi:2-desacetyl-2-hydroxyethyl bacteriochlorophyllide A dehydrogenase
VKTRTLTILNGKVELRDLDTREIGEGEVLIKTEMTAISPGTELRCMAGKQASYDYSYPFVPGYANVGRVIQSRSPLVPEGMRFFSGGSLFTGDYFRMWGAHMGLSIVKGADVVPIPETVPSELAVLSALGAIALHGVKRGGVHKGERVASIGLGAIGSLSALLHKYFGGEVVCCDLSQPRVDLAQEMGLNAFKPEGNMKEGFISYQNQGAELVVDNTGVPAVLSQGLELLSDTPWDNSRQGNKRVLLQGSYPGEFSVDYRTLFTKQVSLIVPRDRQKQDVEEFIGLLEAKTINPKPLVSHILPLDRAAEGYDMLKDPLTTPGTIVFDWSAVE